MTEQLGTSSLPVSAIRSARGAIFFSAADPKATAYDPPGEQGIYRIDGGRTSRICAWPKPYLITIDDHHVYFGDGCVRRVRLDGGDVHRVLLNGWDVVPDGDRLFGAGYTFLLHLARRPELDGPIDDDMTHFEGVRDPRKLAIDAKHVYATLGDPPHTKGSAEVLVKIPKTGGAAVTLASLPEQAWQIAVVGKTVVVLLYQGALVTLSVDGGAIHEIPNTEGVERFQIVGDEIVWVAPYEPRARLVSRRATGGPIRSLADLGHAPQPQFWVADGQVIWAEPSEASYRERAGEHRLLRTLIAEAL